MLRVEIVERLLGALNKVGLVSPHCKTQQDGSMLQIAGLLTR